MRNRVEKISKREWYRMGGFRNSALFRKADRQGRWSYFIDHDHPNASDNVSPFIAEQQARKGA